MTASMPAAVIDQATLAGQRIVIGSLQDITEKVIRVKFTGPSIIIIGEVVNRRLHQASASNGIIESS